MAIVLGPTTSKAQEANLRNPALCEELRVRDILDNLAVTTSGVFVAAYELSGVHSQYHDDAVRNRTKESFEAVLRALPERSIRLHARFEVRESVGTAIDHYVRSGRNENPILQSIDRERYEQWRIREGAGEFLDFRLHLMVHWDPRLHEAGPQWRSTATWTLSAERCIQRSREEHERLVREFDSILAGIETTLGGTGMGFRRLTDEGVFLLLQESLNPAAEGSIALSSERIQPNYKSIRSRLTNVGIDAETDEYLKVGGLLHSFVTLKEPPDATYPGLLREVLSLDFPFVVNVEITIPDQAKVISQFKWQQRKMTAAQRDINGGFRVNVEAQVAERQIIKVLEDVISSSLKTCRLSMTVGVRTSTAIQTTAEFGAAERLLADRRQRVLQTMTRMSGARGMVETLAKRRMFLSGLPTMAEENKREIDMLTLNAADLLPLEAPWQGTPNVPGVLFETRQKKLIPFSPFDPSLTDANMLLVSSSGGGKTFMAQMLLLMLARLNPLISIIERGDSYAPLTELMGGRVVDVDLEGAETLNPWDLPEGQKVPGKDKIAFLKNLTRHMIGESRDADPGLLDSVLSDAIIRVYRRAEVRSTNPVPTFSDLCDELTNWRSADRLQIAVAARSINEAQFAAVKLQDWTGEKGTYGKLFDRHTSIRTDSSWLFFNIEGLRSDSRLETAMSMLIANAMAERSSGHNGQLSITVLDECWSLLDSSVLAPEVVQLFRTARKRSSSVWGISQTLEDFVGTERQPRPHGPGIIKNATTKIIGQQRGDLSVLANHLYLNDVALREIKSLSPPRKGRSAESLLTLGEKAERTQVVRLVPTPVDYWICTTFQRERMYRTYFTAQNPNLPLFDSYRELASRFPRGLAETAELPEESSGEVQAAWAARRKTR